MALANELIVKPFLFLLKFSHLSLLELHKFFLFKLKKKLCMNQLRLIFQYHFFFPTL